MKEERNLEQIIQKYEELVIALKQTYPDGIVFCESALGEKITNLESEIKSLTKIDCCSVCGCRPSVLMITEFGLLCSEHSKYY